MLTDSESIHPATHLGGLALTVPSLETAIRFYQDMLGLNLVRQENGQATLGAGSTAFLTLVEEKEAQIVPRRPGLYHFAILFPSKQALSLTVRRLVQQGWRLQGASDHLVSEAIYLTDPFANGIELYIDRPRQDWPMQNGQVQMDSLPLDVNALLEKYWEEPLPERVDPATRLGHLHLRVSHIARSEAFYVKGLGFNLMQRYGPSARFVSAGGYHHHIGFNIWESAGAPPAQPGAVGLRHFSILVPDLEALNQVEARLEQHTIPFERQPLGLAVQDPDRILIHLLPADQTENVMI